MNAEKQFTTTCGGRNQVVAIQVLDRKLRRNLREMKGQAIAIALVIGCGVAMSVMSLSTLRSLHATRQTYYKRFRFAEVFASFKRGPLSLQQRLDDIPGVARVEPRIVRSVNLIVEGLREPAAGRLISIPDHGQPRLNQVYLRRGRMPDPRRLEVVVGESFANAHGFQPEGTVCGLLIVQLKAGEKRCRSHQTIPRDTDTTPLTEFRISTFRALDSSA